MTDFSSFDDDTKAGSASVNAGAALPIEKPPDQQRFGTLSASPRDLVSDHSAEGAPWLPAARAIPRDPPQAPLWHADHDAPQLPATRGQGRSQHALAATESVHDGQGAKLAYGPVSLGRPYEVIARKMRHLRTNVFDSTGKNVNPVDAPSAPTQIWNSRHDTTPRFIGFDVAPLFQNTGTGPRFSGNHGSVNDSQPDTAQRQFGAVEAQMPSDPYVAQSPMADASANDYDLGF